MSHGTKPFLVLGKGDSLVVVEDVVSAIKVSRVARAIPLFGSHLPTEWMVKIIKERPKRVFIWLDNDKWTESMKFTAKMNTLAPICKSVRTEEDPKVYDETQILLKLL